MAKRKTPQPIKSIPKPGLVSTDTGIYTSTAIDASSPVSVDVEREIVAAARTQAARAMSLEEIDALRDQLRAAIRSAIHKDGTPLKAWVTVTTDLGEGTQTYICDAPPDAGINEAEAALDSLDCFLASAPTEREAKHFLLGLSAGRYIERRYVRTKEDRALVGAKVLGGGKRGGKLGASVTNEAHAELHPEYGPAVTELMAQGMAYYPATDEVGRRLCVHGKTVRKHFPNPTPRSRKSQ